tara:strand:- start:340 stop:474 length:135 start_codon:yes stop_codon:yes gene_type:complete
MKKPSSNEVLVVPLYFVVDSNGLKKYDFKAIRSYLDNRLKLLGE